MQFCILNVILKGGERINITNKKGMEMFSEFLDKQNCRGGPVCPPG